MDTQPAKKEATRRQGDLQWKIAVGIAVVILVIAGLYWGLQRRGPTADEAAIRAACDDILTDLTAALVIGIREGEPVCGLDVSGRQFPGLTIGISLIQTLIIFDASDNLLPELPAWIGDLTNLRLLDVSNNQITTLPDEIQNLENLEILDLRGNPLPPEEVKKAKELLPNAAVSF